MNIEILEGYQGEEVIALLEQASEKLGLDLSEVRKYEARWRTARLTESNRGGLDVKNLSGATFLRLRDGRVGYSTGGKELIEPFYNVPVVIGRAKTEEGPILYAAFLDLQKRRVDKHLVAGEFVDKFADKTISRLQLLYYPISRVEALVVNLGRNDLQLENSTSRSTTLL